MRWHSLISKPRKDTNLSKISRKLHTDTAYNVHNKTAKERELMEEELREVIDDKKHELYELIEMLTIRQVQYLIAFIKVYFKL